MAGSWTSPVVGAGAAAAVVVVVVVAAVVVAVLVLVAAEGSFGAGDTHWRSHRCSEHRQLHHLPLRSRRLCSGCCFVAAGNKRENMF